MSNKTFKTNHFFCGGALAIVLAFGPGSATYAQESADDEVIEEIITIGTPGGGARPVKKKADFDVVREDLLPAPISWISLSYSLELYVFLKSISKILKCISFGCSFNSQQGSFGGDV